MVLFDNSKLKAPEWADPYAGTTVIIDYLTAKVDAYRIVGSDHNEFTMNSIFVPDTSKHLSVNLESGLWQDFKSGRKGNFLQLVAYLEESSSDYAAKLLNTTYGGAMLDKFVEEHLERYKTRKIKSETPVDPGNLASEYGMTTLFEKNDILTKRAIDFLKKKHLIQFSDSFLVARKKQMFGRLIIPYIYNNKIVFFQARKILSYQGKCFPKYLSPPSSSTNISAGEVLYPFDPSLEEILICEGPLDAFVYQKCYKRNATCIQGSSLSRFQLDILKEFKNKTITLALDWDEVGQNASYKIYKQLRRVGVKSIKILKTDKHCPTVKDIGDLWIVQRSGNSYARLDTLDADDLYFSQLEMETLQRQKSGQTK